jgi:GNAT superfamily N-acetyltransferase
MDIEYRQADPLDEGDLFELAAGLATSYTLNKEDFSKTFKKLLNDPSVDLVVAKMDSKPIGYVLAFHHPTFYANGVVSWVEEIYVLEQFRGLNIGKRLMQIVEEKADCRESRLVALATRRAGGFYSAIGYSESASYFKKELR